MRLIVCLDDRNGMMFGGRRQSRDRVLCDRVLKMAQGKTLWMSEYSAKLFGDAAGIFACNDYRSLAKAGDYCFAEDGEISLDGVTRLIVYRWNRHYPSDKVFSYDPESCGFRKISSSDFVGSSHEKITEDIYERV